MRSPSVVSTSQIRLNASLCRLFEEGRAAVETHRKDHS